ncbi:MAG: DUF47 family protein [Thermoleophilia bacterium]
MRRRLGRWFLPEAPDVLGMLRAQVRITVEGLDAFAAWAHGDASQQQVVRDAEHAADAQVRELRRALVTAFATPLEPLDLFELSLRIDTVLNGAKDAVREAEVMGFEPDEAVASMADLLAEGMRHVERAIAALPARTDAATEAADAAVKSMRRVERVYRSAMSALLELDDLREVMARRELYRRVARLAETEVEVGERVWYAVVREA